MSTDTRPGDRVRDADGGPGQTSRGRRPGPDRQPRVAGLLRRTRRTAPLDADRGPTSAALTPAAPRIPGRRNPKWVALGIVAICLGGLLSYAVYARVATESTVVAMAGTVYRGEVVEASDLTTVTLGGSTSAVTVPGGELDGLVGQRAAFDLVKGSILTPGAIRPIAVPATNRSIVGIKVASGRAPTGYLVPGAVVRLVVVPPPNAEATYKDGYSGKSYAAVLVDQQVGPDAASTLVNVDVPEQQAAVVALLAGTDRLTVVRDADR